MKITVSKNAGFCPGVKRADAALNNLIEGRTAAEHIYTLGKLIHNKGYCERLESLAVKSIEFNEVKSTLDSHEGEKMILVIRTHGITKEQNDYLSSLEAQHLNFKVVDMTCPSVKRIHKIAEENTGDDTVFLLFANPSHPEAIGIMSYANGEKYTVSGVSDLEKIDFRGKVPVLCSQTTENLEIFKKIKKFLINLCTNAIFFDTICNVTEKRQSEATMLAARSDLMLIIGGKDSSNTEKLYTLCRKECENSYWIESLGELDSITFDSAKCVGITAGASTPDGIITEVLKTMENKNECFQQMLDDTFKTLHTGDTVNGTIESISDNEIKLDLGVKVTGVLTKELITDDPAAKLRDMFKVGDEIAVFVIRVDDKMGIATVSKKRVDADNSWVVLKDAYDNDVILEGKVVSANKGGVLVAVDGNTVFVPASQTGIAKGEDMSQLVGTTQRINSLSSIPLRKRLSARLRLFSALRLRLRRMLSGQLLQLDRSSRVLLKTS